MKALFLSSLLLLLSVASFAQSPIVVEDSTTTTVPGIGGNAQIGYAFAKGDVVTIEAKATKQLERMMVYRFPEDVVGRIKFTRKPQFSYTMPEDGILIFRFISDRDGTNTVTYKVSRTPASAAVQNYNTKVVWQVPSGRGNPVPTRVEGD